MLQHSAFLPLILDNHTKFVLRCWIATTNGNNIQLYSWILWAARYCMFLFLFSVVYVRMFHRVIFAYFLHIFVSFCFAKPFLYKYIFFFFVNYYIQRVLNHLFDVLFCYMFLYKNTHFCFIFLFNSIIFTSEKEKGFDQIELNMYCIEVIEGFWCMWHLMELKYIFYVDPIRRQLHFYHIHQTKAVKIVSTVQFFVKLLFFSKM